MFLFYIRWGLKEESIWKTNILTSGKYDRLPEPVRGGESGGYRRAGDCGDGCEHGGSGDLL